MRSQQKKESEFRERKSQEFQGRWKPMNLNFPKKKFVLINLNLPILLHYSQTNHPKKSSILSSKLNNHKDQQ